MPPHRTAPPWPHRAPAAGRPRPPPGRAGGATAGRATYRPRSVPFSWGTLPQPEKHVISGGALSLGGCMDVAQAIRLKRAVRSYAARPLPEKAVQAIVLAGRRAQSAKNAQPWHFIAVQERTSLEALSRTGTFAGHLAGAPLAGAILTPDPAQRWSTLFA